MMRRPVFRHLFNMLLSLFVIIGPQKATLPSHIDTICCFKMLLVSGKGHHKSYRKCGKTTLKLELAKWRQKHGLFVFSNARSNLRDHALQSELNKDSISNFVKFELQSMSSKVERAFKKMKKKNSIKIGPKRTSTRTITRCKIPYMRGKTIVRMYC